MFNIQHLDHVAIFVKDMAISAQWYEKVLGLQQYSFEEWGEYPILMLAGKTGVAIFPAQTGSSFTEKGLKIDHFAFSVDRGNFEKAKTHYETLGIDYRFEDHHYFHSIYTTDPDGHKVELTTLVVDEASVYKKTKRVV